MQYINFKMQVLSTEVLEDSYQIFVYHSIGLEESLNGGSDGNLVQSRVLWFVSYVKVLVGLTDQVYTCSLLFDRVKLWKAQRNSAE